MFTGGISMTRNGISAGLTEGGGCGVAGDAAKIRETPHYARATRSTACAGCAPSHPGGNSARILRFQASKICSLTA